MRYTDLMDQATFSFAVADSPSAARPSPSKEWSARAVDSVFGSQKTRWRAHSSEQQESLLVDMLDYSMRREASLQAGGTAIAAAPALQGWLNADPELAALVSRLQANMVSPSDIPAFFAKQAETPEQKFARTGVHPDNQGDLSHLHGL